MYCRTCGNKMNDEAVICVKCGVKRNVGKDYCQVCGTKTVDGMTNCKRCGARLMSAISSTQVRKKVVSKGKKTLGTVLLVLGIIMLFIMAANGFVGFMNGGIYSALSNIGDVGNCGVFGGVFTGIGIGLRKK